MCFGWIDSQVQTIDDKAYRKYFKQRSTASKWSERNRALAGMLEARGLMTDFGRAKIEAAKLSGSWDSPKRERLNDDQLRSFEEMLSPHDAVCANYMKMPRSAREAYAASYYLGAKTEEGRRKRLDAIIQRLELNLNPVESMKKAQQPGSGIG